MKPTSIKILTIWGILFGLCYHFGQPYVTLAHAELIDSNPAPGAILDGSPERITLTFDEPIGSGSTFAIYDKDFALIPVNVKTDATTPNLIVGEQVEIIRSGVYTIQWVTISEDGHPIDGAFSFAVEFENEIETDTEENNMALIAAAEGTAVNLPSWFAWTMVVLAIVVPFIVLSVTRR